MTDVRVTKLTLEVMESETAKARYTRAQLEAVANASPSGRYSRAALELVVVPHKGRYTRAQLEGAFQAAADGRVSRAQLELLVMYATQGRLTRAALELVVVPADAPPAPTDAPPVGGWPTSTNGSTIVRAEIVIEGWPDSWVTDRSISWTPGSQIARLGLSLDGLTVADRVVMYEASCTQEGNTFKIKPPARRQQGATQWDDVATASFSRRANPVGVLAAHLIVGSTVVPTLQGGNTLSTYTTYWLGTEAIRIGSGVITDRGYLSSIDQTHFIPGSDTDAPLYIWDYPPTMEGRRVYLYVWGNGDNGAEAGRLIWRGIVRRPPVLARSGVEWDIQCSGIVDQLKQRLAGDIKSAKVVGIYHHVECAIKIEARYNAYSTPEPTMVVGWDLDEPAMCERINDALEAVLSDIGADVFVESCKLTRSLNQGLRLELRTTGVGAEELVIWLSSPIIGGVNTFDDRWVNSATGAEYNGGPSDTLSVSSTYYAVLTRPHPKYFHPRISGTWSPSEPLDAVNPLGSAFEIMMPFGRTTRIPFFGERWQSTDASDQIDYPPWRVYVDDDFAGVEAVYIPGTDKPDGTFEVLATSTNGYGHYIDLKPWMLASSTGKAILTAAVNGHPSRGFMGFLDGSTEIRARRNYGTGITVFEFIREVHLQAPLYGNRADTPFVTTEDTTAWEPTNGGLGSAALLAQRDYIFFGPVPLYEMLQEELKLLNYFMRINELGLVDAVPMPALTPTSPVSGAHVIAAGDIITPADNYGAWPTWEPMRDGRITTVKYQTEYDGVEETWVDPPQVFVDAMAVTLSKSRGKAVAEVKPYSRPGPFGSSGAVLLASSPSSDTGIKEMALRYLALFARDYDVVTLCVPFTKFDILCGDIVSVTSSHVPDGTGKRGITSVRGVVIERRWPIDPQGDCYGKLTIMLVQEGVSGYAPSGLITGQTNTSGTTWALTLSTTSAGNVLFSTNDDGLVLEHFAAGDYIRVVQYDSFSPTIVTGTISGAPNVAAGTCTVVLDGAWTPGASAWVLEFQEGTSTAAQKKYAYVADSTFLLTDGSFSRMFA